MLRGIECDILPDGRLDLPDDVLAELDWVQASVHRGQRTPRRELTARVEEALRDPYVRCLSHPTAGSSVAARRTRSTSSACSRSRSRGRRDRGQRAPTELDLRGAHVRDAIRAGVRIVCSTDAHSARGLDAVELAVRTARRGWATAGDVLNTGPLRRSSEAGAER